MRFSLHTAGQGFVLSLSARKASARILAFTSDSTPFPCSAASSAGLGIGKGSAHVDIRTQSEAGQPETVRLLRSSPHHLCSYQRMLTAEEGICPQPYYTQTV
eukprot:scpid93293/ scgid29311/ 